MTAKEGGHVKDSDPDTVVNCVKQRKTGVEPMYNLWFDKHSRQYLGHRDDMPKQYIF